KKITERPFVLLLDEAAVAQAEVSASREDGGVVAGVVRGAGAAAIKGHGVVEEPGVAFADRSETIEEISELLGEVAIVACPVERVVVMAQAVMSAGADAEDR